MAATPILHLRRDDKRCSLCNTPLDDKSMRQLTDGLRSLQQRRFYNHEPSRIERDR